MLPKEVKPIFEKLSGKSEVIEQSISMLLALFPTKAYINRFIVGYAIECIIADNSGCTVTENSKRTDITDGKSNFSIKYSSKGNIKLYNTLGLCKTVDICPTFLIFPTMVLYIDKEILNHVHGDFTTCLKNTKDGCILFRRKVMDCVKKFPSICFNIKLSACSVIPVDIARYVLRKIVYKRIQCM